MSERKLFIDPSDKLSTRTQCILLSIPRSSLVYKPAGESTENLKIMRLMDIHYMHQPSYGVLRMQDHLSSMDF